ncbi:MAG TPA: SprA-related family protein [Planctomycetaceae bacterium]|nr:SprA-related family protein [Planctomycetaceae bacterium]
MRSTSRLAGRGDNSLRQAEPATPRPRAIEDKVEFSEEAQIKLAGSTSGQEADAEQTEPFEGLPGRENRTEPKEQQAGRSTNKADGSQAAKKAESAKPPKLDAELTPEELEQVKKLAARDREVRAHEQAHLATAGQYARGGPTYSYQQGPDGKRYAIGGEVQIDTSPVDGDPKATAQKARVVRAAALAPAQPSAQDLRVAAAATQMEQQALAELRQQLQSKALGNNQNPYAKSVPLSGTRLNVVA